jgi:hypothetical protein
MKEKLPAALAANPERAAEGGSSVFPQGAIRDEGDVGSDEVGDEAGHLDMLWGFGSEELENSGFGEDAARGAVFDKVVGEERGDGGAIAAEGWLEELRFEGAQLFR